MLKNINIFFFLFLFTEYLFAQDGNMVFLKNAESLVGMVINGEQVRELSRNVELVQGNVNLKCNKARQYFNSNKIEVSGNVIITQDTLKLFTNDGIYFGDTRNAICNSKVKLNDGHVTLTSKKGSYDANTHKAFFQDDVMIEDKDNTIFSDFLTFFRNENIIHSWKNVKLLSKDNSTIICGDSLDYWQKLKHTKVYSNAFLLRVDTTILKSTSKNQADSILLDTLFLKSGILESVRDSNKSILFASDSVRLFRNELSSLSGKLVYSMKDSIFQLEKSPVLWYSNNQIMGDSLNIFLKESTLYKIESNRNAFALSQNDTINKKRFNQISGETIRIFFKNKKIDSIISENQSRALYYLQDDDKSNGLNKTSGDKIMMLFESGKIQNVKVLNGVEGNYFPENMVFKRETEYNLPNFKIIQNRPKRSDY
jgi:lipopolysaccharide export system protein LptA